VSIGLMMAQTLDEHWFSKLERERIANRLNNPKLEADLYPVGSWRDHPPTGVVVDLSQPRVEPPPAKNDDDDEDDDNSQAGAAAASYRETLSGEGCGL
jgi:penicillin amidase